MGRNLFVYLVFTVRVLNTPIFRRKLHICTALQSLPCIIQYLFDINIPRHSVSGQSTYLPNILCKLHREVHNPFHVIAGAQSITS